MSSKELHVQPRQACCFYSGSLLFLPEFVTACVDGAWLMLHALRHPVVKVGILKAPGDGQRVERREFCICILYSLPAAMPACDYERLHM
jgi:hypothetical protein